MPIAPETIASLATMPDRFEQLFRSVACKQILWMPQSWEGVPGEMFSALEHACHLRDIEVDGYQVRIRRPLEESRPLLPSLDGYALAEERRYRESDAAAVLTAFRDARRATVDRIGRLGDEQLSRPAMFEGHGAVTVLGIVRLLCSHDLQHLACMQWLLAKMDAPATLD